MKYIDFRHALSGFTVFSLSDIKRIDSSFFPARLNEWQKKGYIKKIVRGYYIFGDLEINEQVLFYIAGRIYTPSYISMESALGFYGLIPESVYGVTSVSTLKTYKFTTPLVAFIYRSLKPDNFFGYEFGNFENKPFKIAQPEKAVLDYLYFHPGLKNVEDFRGLRINVDVFWQKVGEQTFYDLLGRFKNKSLENRSNTFIRFIKND